MIKYVLNYYNLATDGGVCFEHEDKEIVVAEALRRCSIDKGEYTYRMEKWNNGRIVYDGFRFFEDGRETTQDLINAILNS